MQTIDDDYIEELLMTTHTPLPDVLYKPGKSVPAEGRMRFRKRDRTGTRHSDHQSAAADAG